MTKLKKLQGILKNLKRVLVAFSGGCDSSFLLAAAVQTLGRENVSAATAVSNTYTPSELTHSITFAKKMNVQHVIVKTNEFKNKNFTMNPFNRCYYCKNELFSKLDPIAKKNSMKIIDGTNAADTSDFRPGIKAADRWSVCHPLMKAKLSKADIRQFSKEMGLATWNIPANACLASRIPFGELITKEKLQKIYRAEKFLKSLGCKTVRVRLHDTMLARIEVAEKEIRYVIRPETRRKITRYFKKLGFNFVTIDLQGYRTGSFNPAKKIIEKNNFF